MKFIYSLLSGPLLVLAQQLPFDSASSRHESDLQKLFGNAWSPSIYNGIVTLFNVPPLRCFGDDKDIPFDVAILGAPFDTAVTYRTGARFGPNGIRQGGRRITPMEFSYNVALGIDPLKGEGVPKLVDCGDVPMSFFDNPTAFRQLEKAEAYLLTKNASTQYDTPSLTRTGRYIPRILTLGGDHSITLPILRPLAKAYGPLTLLHFDSHLDSWDPRSWGGDKDADPRKLPITHGSQLFLAAKEGLVSNTSSMHLGIRTRVMSPVDYDTDKKLGFKIIHADEIEDIGYKGVIQRIKERVGQTPVYISFDIDVLDPAHAPATGTPEIGGWTTREVKKILQGLDGIKIVGADIVEVAPAYDSQDEITSLAAANIAWEMVSLMAKTPTRREETRQ